MFIISENIIFFLKILISIMYMRLLYFLIIFFIIISYYFVKIII